MNDRASAMPPVHFIGPEDRVSLDKSEAMATICTVVSEESASPPNQQPPPQPPAVSKRGSKQFLGQVWDGVRERLRIKRDPAPEKKQPAALPPDDRPSRDEIFANYQQLVASGFFSSHAIQSTRQPGPTRPSTSTGGPSSSAHPRPAPQWPLPQPPLTPNRSRPSSPIRSPASASSRGTKRAVEQDDDEDDDQLKNHKKLRKTASATRDMAIPKLRSSSRLAAARRSVSTAAAPAPAPAPTRNVSAAAPRETNKLTKRVLGRLPLQVPDRASSAARRKVRETQRPVLDNNSQPARVLRPRRSAAEPLRVRPDANRGIPSVPDIPAKFTYGEDRENDGPWRGLRRGNANASFYNP